MEKYDIVVPSREIPDYMFKDSSLRRIIIPHNFTTIGKEAFYNCYLLEELQIPKNITEIGESAFEKCIRLTSVYVNATTVKNYAFLGCVKLKNLILGPNVTSFGMSAFDLQLGSVTCEGHIPPTLFDINNNANGYNYVYVPFPELKAYSDAHSCSSYRETFVQDNNDIDIIYYKTSDNTELGTEGFSFNVAVDESAAGNMSTPGGAQGTQGAQGGYYYYTLEQGTQSHNFDGYYSSSLAYRQYNADTFSDEIFKLNTKVKNVVLSNKLKRCSGTGHFSGCTRLVTVTLPEDLKSVPKSMFVGCTSLKCVTLPNEVTIGYSSFSGCTSLEYVFSLGHSITAIDGYAFCGCSQLKRIITKPVTTIGNYAFSGCTQLLNVDLSNVTQIGEYAFAMCTSLYPNIPSKKPIDIMAHSFEKCNISEIVDLHVSSLGQYAFRGCSNLGYVSMSGTTSTSFSYANYVFSECTNLTEIKILNPTPPTISSSFFNRIDNLTSIKVPSASVSAYKAASRWSTKASIISGF